MKTIIAHLELSTNDSANTRERCPSVVFTVDDQETIAIRTDVERPNLPFDEGHLHSLVLHDDALSRVIDEEAWLTEFTRVLAPGGTLAFTLPATGMLAWLDTMNAYRYFADVSGRGTSPNAALPTGWNRHYSKAEIHRLLANAGFVAPTIRSQNYVLQEVGMLTGMLRDNWFKQDKHAEHRLFPRFGRRHPAKRSGIRTTWSVTVRKS